MPGYRSDEDRVNRSQNFMNVSQHDVPNIKYEFDYRLPVLFRYGFDFGYNQMVIPKGRVVAADPVMNLKNFESSKEFNVLTVVFQFVFVRLEILIRILLVLLLLLFLQEHRAKKY